MGEQALAFAASGSPARGTFVTTLSDLVGVFVDEGATDAEVISIVSDLGDSGRVRLLESQPFDPDPALTSRVDVASVAPIVREDFHRNPRSLVRLQDRRGKPQ